MEAALTNGFGKHRPRIALLGNFPPRRCGIATFTEDLHDALVRAGYDVRVIAMDDRPEGYDYPETVDYELLQNDIDDYRQAAAFIAKSNCDVLCVQHEFGIFGGPAGNYLLELLERVEIPIVTTLHTVLREPDANQRQVMESLRRLSSRVIVMSERGREYLEDTYSFDPKRIEVIHHGIHPLPAGLSPAKPDRVLTFGLLGPDKGIENVISALPELVEKHQGLEYVIVGATHPNLVAQHGESYRESLEELAANLGVEDRIRFVNRFVTRDELAELIGSAAIYVTPYNKLQQITSGTLAYAIGTGRAVVSTPYWYAEELLADGRGILVPPKNPGAIANALDRLLSSDDERNTIAARAKEFGEQMLWDNVATAYGKVFDDAVTSDELPIKVSPMAEFKIPDLDLRHLSTLTDDVGIIQHATFNVPNRAEGYCSDDNARALQFATLAYDAGLMDRATSLRLSAKYLSFVAHAFEPDSGVFRNFMSYDRRWLEARGSDDSQGRCVQALGLTAASGCDPGIRDLAKQLFDESLENAMLVRSPRALAFVALGAAHVSEAYLERPTAAALDAVGEVLSSSLVARRGEDWVWFEDSVTYCNAVLPHALLRIGEARNNSACSESGLEALEWLARKQSDKQGRFLPIGSNGFMRRNGSRALFDQQPVEAWTSLSAYSTAYRITGEKLWLNRARAAFGWLLGENHLDLPLYEPENGGCRDGLHADRANQNMGAESTLSMLLSLCEWKLITKTARSAQPLTVHTM